MLPGRVLVLIFTYAIVQIECNITDWSKDYPLPYQLNFTDNRHFEIGCMLIIYVRLIHGSTIGLHDENNDVNFFITVRGQNLILNYALHDVWATEIFICDGEANFTECTNNGDVSEVIIERVEGGYNVIINGKRRNPNVFPNKVGTEAIFLLVQSEVGKNFEVTGITALLPDPT
ncbi:unnamed protein product [Bursaphelenchus xylophilus]|uniref:(pine wood nematode) hypothetical protein n=1 Tax=Bursaphelenchus xylophilus TaxID=6326 RepID=A0A1I7RUD7_BURXY|nr:unnamed protein product [Bursaphelenchus xylophilus]CAG9114056.1 unnamed protein product [Bursaphelenchus xylophilus]